MKISLISPISVLFPNMTNKIISTLTKSLGSKIVWIGGATAGLTALFSALGFLVLKGHHDLLGISGLVPTAPNAWTIEGAKFVYSTGYVLFAGCLNRIGVLALALVIVALLSIASSATVLAKIRKHTAPPLVRWFLIAVTLALLIGSLALMVQGLTGSHLLINPSDDVFQQQIEPRTADEGLENLAFRYAAFAMGVAFLAVWLHVLPRCLFAPPAKANAEADAAPEHPVWYSGLWGIFLIHLVLLPILYGQLVKSNDFFKVCLLPAIEETGASTSGCAGQEGWLLYKGADEIALYVESSAAKPVQVFQQKEFKQVQVLAYANVMTAIPKPSSSGTTQPSSRLTIADMGELLQNIPATIAAGIRTMSRTILFDQRTLVVANQKGETLNAFSPFRDDQKGSLQSPVWLPDSESILYVEVVEKMPRLKIVAANFDPNSDTVFGASPIQGWEPQLTPDGQFIIFRQQTTLVRVDINGTNPTTLYDDLELDRLLGVFSEPDNQGYSLVYSKKQENTTTYWSAIVRGDTVVTPEQQLDEDIWELFGRMSIQSERILYEQADSMTLVKNFKLIEQSFKELRNENIPENVLEMLKPLEDKKFIAEKEFLDAIKKQIGEEQTVRYKASILKWARDTEWVLAGEDVGERDETSTRTFLNLYLSDSPETEGRKITNTKPGRIPSHNRYPAWNPDGSMMVYVSGE